MLSSQSPNRESTRFPDNLKTEKYSIYVGFYNPDEEGSGKKILFTAWGAIPGSYSVSLPKIAKAMDQV